MGSVATIALLLGLCGQAKIAGNIVPIVVGTIYCDANVILVRQIFFYPLHKFEAGLEEASNTTSAVILVLGVFRIVAALIDGVVSFSQPVVKRLVVFGVAAFVAAFVAFLQKIGFHLPTDFSAV